MTQQISTHLGDSIMSWRKWSKSLAVGCLAVGMVLASQEASQAARRVRRIAPVAPVVVSGWPVVSGPSLAAPITSWYPSYPAYGMYTPPGYQSYYYGPNGEYSAIVRPPYARYQYQWRPYYYVNGVPVPVPVGGGYAYQLGPYAFGFRY